MIAVKEDDCVVGQTIGLQLFQDRTRMGIHVVNVVVVLRPVTTNLGGVWLIRGDSNVCGIADEGVRTLPDLALVSAEIVEHREEGLPGFAIAPVGLWTGV